MVGQNSRNVPCEPKCCSRDSSSLKKFLTKLGTSLPSTHSHILFSVVMAKSTKVDKKTDKKKESKKVDKSAKAVTNGTVC